MHPAMPLTNGVLCVVDELGFESSKEEIIAKTSFAKVSSLWWAASN
jgi:hypothetical protein